MPKINRETLGSFRLIVPPQTIQRSAVETWSTVHERASSMLDNLARALTLLKEQRSAVIADALK